MFHCYSMDENAQMFSYYSISLKYFSNDITFSTTIPALKQAASATSCVSVFHHTAMHCSNVAVAERYGHLSFRGNTVWMEILIKICFSFLFSGCFEIIYYFSSNPVCGYNLAKVKRSTRCKPEKANSDFPQIVHSLDVNCHRKTYWTFAARKQGHLIFYLFLLPKLIFIGSLPAF